MRVESILSATEQVLRVEVTMFARSKMNLINLEKKVVAIYANFELIQLNLKYRDCSSSSPM